MRLNKKGKAKGTAVLRTIVDKKAQTYAVRRLIRDLDEIKSNTIPTVGVTASPLEDSLFEWHGNLRGPEGTPYEGGVFHIQMTFPQSYPLDPPSLRLFTSLEHPNVFHNRLCLDMLESGNKGLYKGWTSAYSVMSILIQLQSYLFEVPTDIEDIEVRSAIKKAVRTANEFECEECGHRGPLCPSPPFQSRESDLDAFIMVKSDEDRLAEELVCSTTRLPHTEAALGVGVTISRVPRTGEIRSVFPTMDLVSLRAFSKQNIRLSADNEKFTHWLPLYFGDNRERTLHLARRALSMMCTGSTRKFEPKMVLDVLPQLLVTLVFQIMDEHRHASLKALRFMGYFHRLLLLLVAEYPEVAAQCDDILGKFIADRNYRHKDHVSSLGTILILLMISQKYTWNDIREAYMEESNDRAVSWIFRDLPELDDPEKSSLVSDEERARVSFQSQIVSKHIVLFMVHYLRMVRPAGVTVTQFAQVYDKRLGHLPAERENTLQHTCVQIKEVNDFDEYFDKLGLPKKTVAELKTMFLKAEVNAKAKKYYGKVDEIHVVPDSSVVVHSLHASTHPALDSFVAAGSNAADPLNPNEDVWREQCIKRYDWIAQIAKYQSHSLSADFVARKHRDTFFKTDSQSSVGTATAAASPSKLPYDIPANFTWRELYLKLNLEDILLQMNDNPDFTGFYRALDLSAPYLRSLNLTIPAQDRIKSGYHFVTALLLKLVKLEQLAFSTAAMYSSEHTAKFLRCLVKGIKNNVSSTGTGSLRILDFSGCPSLLTDASLHEKVYECVAVCASLDTLLLSNSYIKLDAAKKLSKLLCEHRALRSLDLSACSIDAAAAKVLADGLMRAKALQKLNVARNRLGAGAAAVAYAVSFSSSIVYLDLSGDSQSVNSAQQDEVAEALYKLLHISGSLQELYLQQTPYKLRLDFFKALGMHPSLRVLNLSHMAGLESTWADHLGRAIAFNAQSRGHLTNLYLDGKLDSKSLNTLFESMWVSRKHHELWYGDAAKAEKMIGDDLERYFHCNLSELSMNQCVFSDSLATSDPKTHFFAKLFARANKITHLYARKAGLTKALMEALAVALNPPLPSSAHSVASASLVPWNVKVLDFDHNSLLKKEGVNVLIDALKSNSTVEVLKLGRTNMGVSGAQKIGKYLADNSSLKHLNLFGNIIDVDGARSLAEALRVNTTIEYLDIGFNRVRDEGLRVLSNALAANPNSSLKHLGLRNNFLSDAGVMKMVEILSAPTRLEYLALKGNYISDAGLVAFEAAASAKQLLFNVDLYCKLKELLRLSNNRSVWVALSRPDPDLGERHIREALEKDCGYIVSVRIRQKKLEGKGPSQFAFVEFGHESSVPRALDMAASGRGLVDGNRVRIFRAGTSTRVFIPKKKTPSSTSRAKSDFTRFSRVFHAGRGGSRGGRGGSRGGSRGGRGGRR